MFQKKTSAGMSDYPALLRTNPAAPKEELQDIGVATHMAEVPERVCAGAGEMKSLGECAGAGEMKPQLNCNGIHCCYDLFCYTM